MSRNSLALATNLRSGARVFARDLRGGVATISALVVVPLCFIALVMVDYSRASSAKQALQEGLDAATLIAARSTAMSADEIDAIGDRALKAEVAGNDSIEGIAPNSLGRISVATFSPTNSTVQSTVTATTTPLISGAFIGPIKIRATSQVTRSVTKFEIALALDTTGSMGQNNKIGRLRTAAATFIDTMEDAAARSTVPNAVRLSVVPFSTTVRVSAPMSMASYNTATHSMSGLPTWLDGRARAFDYRDDIFNVGSATTSNRDRFRMLKQMGVSWGGCVEARKAPYDIQETSPTTGNLATLFTPYFSPDEPDVALKERAPSIYTQVSFKESENDYLADGFGPNTKKVNGKGFTWRMAQGNTAKYNTTVFRNTGKNPYGNTYGPNSGCEMQQMQRLSNNFNSLKSTVAGLVATGETNLPLGLMWGWHAVSPNAPLADGSAYGSGVTKVIILMTDGDNVMGTNDSNSNSHYHGYGFIWQNKLGTTSPSNAQRTKVMDQRTEAICSNIKARKIAIYTVGVGVSNNARKLLQSCASSPAAYFDVDLAAKGLDEAFASIAGSIENLRISR